LNSTDLAEQKMKSKELTKSKSGEAHRTDGELFSPLTNIDSVAKNVPERSTQKVKWAWDEWFQLVMIIALFIILLFPLWWFLYDLFFRR
jgi:hypothetical protein